MREHIRTWTPVASVAVALVVLAVLTGSDTGYLNNADSALDQGQKALAQSRRSLA